MPNLIRWMGTWLAGDKPVSAHLFHALLSPSAIEEAVLCHQNIPVLTHEVQPTAACQPITLGDSDRCWDAGAARASWAARLFGGMARFTVEPLMELGEQANTSLALHSFDRYMVGVLCCGVFTPPIDDAAVWRRKVHSFRGPYGPKRVHGAVRLCLIFPEQAEAGTVPLTNHGLRFASAVLQFQIGADLVAQGAGSDYDPRSSASGRFQKYRPRHRHDPGKSKVALMCAIPRRATAQADGSYNHISSFSWRPCAMRISAGAD